MFNKIERLFFLVAIRKMLSIQVNEYSFDGDFSHHLLACLHQLSCISESSARFSFMHLMDVSVRAQGMVMRRMIAEFVHGGVSRASINCCELCPT